METPVVFVVDPDGQPLLPTHPARARQMLRDGKAEVLQMVPFTLRLKRRIEAPIGTFTVGLDDGAKDAGLAVVDDAAQADAGRCG